MTNPYIITIQYEPGKDPYLDSELTSWEIQAILLRVVEMKEE